MKATEQINTKNAPKALGPYSQAIRSNGFIFCSGQIGINPKNLTLRKGIKAQTNQAILNLKEVLTSSGSSLNDIVRVDIFLSDISTFGAVNEIYAKYFSVIKPARQTVEVAALPKEALIEISCIANMKNNITVKAIDEAALRINKVVKNTPLEYSKRLSEKYKAKVFFKREDLQEVRSYKIRGAFNLMQTLDVKSRQKGIVAASAGNHAQGVAYGCSHMKTKA